MKAQALSEVPVFQLLANRYAGSDWALIPQVPDGTGSAKSRTADAIAMSLWPSRGLELHGFEIKVSRADWLKELNGSGAKSDAIGRFCDRWWIVATHGIVKLEELPKGWGWMEVTKNGAGIKIKKHAPENSPQPIDRAFLAGLLRAADRHFANLHKPEGFERKMHERYSAGYAAGRKFSERHPSESWEAKYHEIAEQVLAFTAASGIRLDSYTDGRELGELVNKARLLDGYAMRQKAGEIRRAAASLTHIADQICPEEKTT